MQYYAHHRRLAATASKFPLRLGQDLQVQQVVYCEDLALALLVLVLRSDVMARVLCGRAALFSRGLFARLLLLDWRSNTATIAFDEHSLFECAEVHIWIQRIRWCIAHLFVFALSEGFLHRLLPLFAGRTFGEAFRLDDGYV